MVSATRDSILEICNSLIKSFFRLLKFAPDIIEAIENLFMGEEDEVDEDEKGSKTPKGEVENKYSEKKKELTTLASSGEDELRGEENSSETSED